MNEILVACGDVALLKNILGQLPPNTFKPIATKNGGGTAQKVANRALVLAIVHAELADQKAGELLKELKAQQPALPILLLTSSNPPSNGPFDRALRYPLPGPVLRNAIKGMVKTEEEAEDLDRWKAFYQDVKKRLARAPEQSYYELLGLQNGAPHHELVKAFDKLSMHFHPDRYTQYQNRKWGKALYEKINAYYKLLTQAYGVVSDRRLRSLYEDALSGGELRLDPEETNIADRGPRSIAESATTNKGRRFLKMAQTELAKGNQQAALRNLQFALSMEPDNRAIEKKIEELKG